ncbi:DUF2742 domain-containing protein [Mycolicibacterium sphagni]|uniref:DUF2742 domain-containing protein n=1 Tax=Mycolicibacterium sphagni TaxID=1786 RepID=UPI0021F2A4B5|nr:DUF2742 domain-containing protein [Mycolicibacterium sphagni]MCV7175454.1 DUF2742 domain-containing protein [Mycolicibacterium sphagni]
MTWFEPVHLFVKPWLDVAGDWPLIGTPEWTALPHDHPQRWAAILDAASRWALDLETRQTALAEASRDIAGAADWSSIAQAHKQRADFYAAKPWLRRAVS